MTKVIKSHGALVDYDSVKVRNSVERTGANKHVVEHVMQEVEQNVRDGMTTHELYKMVFDELKKESLCYACRYNLRTAILKLGPAGFKFEKYVAAILRAYKYDAKVPDDEIEGSCVSHEVDVVAEKNGRTMFIEAKFRNDYKDSVNLKDTMATWSRFLDLVDGGAVGKCQHFDEAWIVTNARFSDRAKKFGVCKGIHMIGWSFPEERSFQGMVDYTTLYPVTVLGDLTTEELESFAQNRMMLCREISEQDPEDLAERIGLSTERAYDIVEMCSLVIEGDHDSKLHPTDEENK
ncbi:MAG: ATP cone domain-containing protein [Patescibacteria group bacterium]